MIRISTQQIQKQTLSPVMQQSIGVLLLHTMDLNAAIEQELEDNPMLEINEQETRELQSKVEEAINKLERIKEVQQSFSQPDFYNDDDTDGRERILEKYIGLEEKLLKQLRVEVDDLQEIAIGEFIIGSLDEDGYLKVDIDEIAENTETNNIDRIKKVLSIIQGFEPEGIAARDLKECLLLQTRSKNMNGLTTIVEDIINGFIPELGKKHYREIAKKLKTDIGKVKEASCVISSLDPRPARNFRPIKENIYIKPDIFISKNSDEDNFKAHLNKEGIPSLRVNMQYKEMLKNSLVSGDTKEFLQENLKKALSFIQSIEQRGSTLQRISEFILEKQKNFFEDGMLSLVPMTLEDVATHLDRNKSTISRAISNKYIATPHGLFPMKIFFSQGINEHTNGAVASKSVKEEIRELTACEDKAHPLSDKNIQNYFEKRGMQIARRTISKYRQSLHILPSHLRKK